jgi:hypothetical protein
MALHAAYSMITVLQRSQFVQGQPLGASCQDGLREGLSSQPACHCEAMIFTLIKRMIAIRKEISILPTSNDRELLYP